MEEVMLTAEIPGLRPCIRGKVRDVFDLGPQLLIVATDRISAFDSVLPTGIPDKGRVLNQLSAFWFGLIQDECPNHFLSMDLERIEEALRPLAAEASFDALAGRSMLVRKTEAIPIEAVVRGYLDGSAWREYRESGSVCGIELPAGLEQGSKLPQPIFTPATKGQSGHDVNITHEEMAGQVDPGVMREMIELSLRVYTRAAEYARGRGIIIADTKFEFGLVEGRTVMIDECLTPDSSRFWDAGQYRPGGPQPSFDKQFVRDYLDSTGWDHEPPAPPLPPEVVELTAEKYRETFRRLAGRELD